MKQNQIEILCYSVITGVRFAEHDSIIFIEIEVGQLLPMGLVDPKTVYWQGPPKNLNSNLISFNYVFRTFFLDMVSVEKGFLSGIQIFKESDSLRLAGFFKTFTSFTEGKMSDNEEVHYDSDKTNNLYNLQDKIPSVSERPGKITTNWNYNLLFGTSSQICKNCRSSFLFEI